MNVESYLHAFVDDDGPSPRIVAITRDGSGRRVERRFLPEYVAYLHASDVDETFLRRLRDDPTVASYRQEADWHRFGWRAYEFRKQAVFGREGLIYNAGIKTYEGDVDPVTRWITDKSIQIAKPLRAYLDIETDSRVPFSRKEESRVLSWAIVDDNDEATCLILPEDTDRAEKEFLHQFWEELEAYDQITAWNGDNFDFEVLWARSAYHGLRVDARRWLHLDHLTLFKRMNQHSSESADEKRSMKLQNIAMSVLGVGKDDFDASKTWEAWAAGGKERALLAKYNVKDTRLLRMIEQETGYITLFQTLCEACSVFGESRSLNPTRQMDGFLLKLGLERGHHFPTKKFRESDEGKFKGAYVMEPKTDGIMKGVHVADFSSLYPSIILTWNMSPDTLADEPVNGPIKEGTCRSPLTGVSFTTTHEGLLPSALREILRLRKFWNDKKASLPPGTPEWHEADRRSTAYKVAANSFYGVVGSPYSRFFNRSVAESVTQNGKWLIQHTIAQAEEKGWNVIYADTDSLFVTGVDRTTFDTFVSWCNKELYPPLLEKQGCTENHIKLAYEKAFERIVLTTAKRYCGKYEHYKWQTTCAKCPKGTVDLRKMQCKDCGATYETAPRHTGKPEIKGLEFKRGDTALLAQKLQEEVITALMDGMDELEEFHTIISRARTHVLEEELPLEEVSLSKALSRPVKEYAVKTKKDGTDAAQPPHVVVAKILTERGEEVREGTRIEYVVTDGEAKPMKVIPASDYNGNVDRYELWEQAVFPPTMRLLAVAFPGHDWTQWQKVRPPKPKAATRKRIALEEAGQLTLDTGPSLTVPRGTVNTNPPLPPRAPKRGGDFVVRVKAKKIVTLETLHEVFRRHPGSRKVVVELELDDGTVAELATEFRVSGTPKLLSELASFAA